MCGLKIKVYRKYLIVLRKIRKLAFRSHNKSLLLSIVQNFVDESFKNCIGTFEHLC